MNQNETIRRRYMECIEYKKCPIKHQCDGEGVLTEENKKYNCKKYEPFIITLTRRDAEKDEQERVRGKV